MANERLSSLRLGFWWIVSGILFVILAAIAYVRYTHEIEYGGAARVFYRQSNPAGRVRAVRR